jgi:hypothetical protein
MDNLLILLAVLGALAIGSLIAWALVHRNDERSGYHWTDTDF